MGEGGEGGGGLRGLMPSPRFDFKPMLLCVQAVTAKRRPKFIIIEKQKRKKQLSGYKQSYTYQNQSLEEASELFP